MVSSSNEDPETEKDNLLMLRSRQVDGVIVNTTGSNLDLFKSLLGERFPFVLLDRSLGGINADTVVVNNVEGVKQAIQFLIDQGHRRIGIVLHTLGNRSPRIERLEGYKQALISNNMAIDESLIKICNLSRGNGIKATEELLSLQKRPTAIFATNEMLNLEVLTGIKKCGLKVPDDISVIGYDDFPWIPLLDPPLSTVAQPAYEMGVKAAALLISNIKRKRKRRPQIIQLEPQLVIRNSCQPPKR